MLKLFYPFQTHERHLEKIKNLKERPNFPKDRIFIREDTWLKSGVIDDVIKSTVEKGEKIFNIFTEAFIEKIRNLKLI